MRLSLARFIANMVGSMGVTVYFWTYIVDNVSLMGVTSVTFIILLSLAGYDGTLQVQGDGAILMIRLLASVIPSLLYLVIILIMKT